MKGKVVIVAAAVAAGAVLGAVKDDVHGYTPKGYVQPKEPEVRERLEWFKDQKLALMMCLGLYSTIGIKESWPLCDSKAKKLLHVGSGQSFDCVNMGNGVSFDLPSDFKADANADVFRIVRRAERQ